MQTPLLITYEICGHQGLPLGPKVKLNEFTRYRKNKRFMLMVNDTIDSVKRAFVTSLFTCSVESLSQFL